MDQGRGERPASEEPLNCAPCGYLIPKKTGEYGSCMPSSSQISKQVSHFTSPGRKRPGVPSSNSSFGGKTGLWFCPLGSRCTSEGHIWVLCPPCSGSKRHVDIGRAGPVWTALRVVGYFWTRALAKDEAIWMLTEMWPYFAIRGGGVWGHIGHASLGRPFPNLWCNSDVISGHLSLFPAVYWTPWFLLFGP